MTIEVPERVVERAAELGVPVDTLVAQAFDAIMPALAPTATTLSGTRTMTRSEAGAAIREIARTHTLDGIRVKDLIEEGRR